VPARKRHGCAHGSHLPVSRYFPPLFSFLLNYSSTWHLQAFGGLNLNCPPFLFLFFFLLLIIKQVSLEAVSRPHPASAPHHFVGHLALLSLDLLRAQRPR
jgi:hypothetical protein